MIERESKVAKWGEIIMISQSKRWKSDEQTQKQPDLKLKLEYYKVS